MKTNGVTNSTENLKPARGLPGASNEALTLHIVSSESEHLRRSHLIRGFAIRVEPEGLNLKRISFMEFKLSDGFSGLAPRGKGIGHFG